MDEEVGGEGYDYSEESFLLGERRLVSRWLVFGVWVCGLLIARIAE